MSDNKGPREPKSAIEPNQDPTTELSFELDATEQELLDEFGVLMAAEYPCIAVDPIPTSTPPGIPTSTHPGTLRSSVRETSNKEREERFDRLTREWEAKRAEREARRAP